MLPIVTRSLAVNWSKKLLLILLLMNERHVRMKSLNTVFKTEILQDLWEFPKNGQNHSTQFFVLLMGHTLAETSYLEMSSS